LLFRIVPYIFPTKPRCHVGSTITAAARVGCVFLPM
jgi:hypothetical protein